MAIQELSAIWKDNLIDGNGGMCLDLGVYEGAFSRDSRFEVGLATNPDELIGVVNAGCFSMYLNP